MGTQRHNLTDDYIDFINQQHIFFIGTAPTDTNGYVSCSPKGLDSLRIINDKTIVWLNLTGSGNETAAHVQENQRMTIMFASFTERSLILRVYGKAKVYHYGSTEFNNYLSLFGEMPGARQMFELDIEMVQGSCGLSMPYYEFKSDRRLLTEWAKEKGKAIKDYWMSRNLKTVNGKDTNIDKLIP